MKNRTRALAVILAVLLIGCLLGIGRLSLSRKRDSDALRLFPVRSGLKVIREDWPAGFN